MQKTEAMTSGKVLEWQGSRRDIQSRTEAQPWAAGAGPEKEASRAHEGWGCLKNLCKVRAA